MEKSVSSRRLQPKRLHNLEVHHKIHLTLDNVDDPSIALNLDNLLLLCKECHNKMHGRFNGKQPKYKWNEEGDLVEVREEGNR